MNPNPLQPPLFTLPAQPAAPDTVQVHVVRVVLGYRAEIAGGWWVAYGSTEREAVQRVVRLYEGEMG